MFFLLFLVLGIIFIAGILSPIIFDVFLVGDAALVLVGGVLAAFGFVLLI